MPRTIDYLHETAQYVLIVTNPSAGSGANQDQVQELAARLSANRMRVEITSDLAQVQRVATSSPSGLRAVTPPGGSVERSGRQPVQHSSKLARMRKCLVIRWYG